MDADRAPLRGVSELSRLDRAVATDRHRLDQRRLRHHPSRRARLPEHHVGRERYAQQLGCRRAHQRAAELGRLRHQLQLGLDRLQFDRRALRQERERRLDRLYWHLAPRLRRGLRDLPERLVPRGVRGLDALDRARHRPRARIPPARLGVRVGQPLEPARDDPARRSGGGSLHERGGADRGDASGERGARFGADHGDGDGGRLAGRGGIGDALESGGELRPRDHRGERPGAARGRGADHGDDGAHRTQELLPAVSRDGERDGGKRAVRVRADDGGGRRRSGALERGRGRAGGRRGDGRAPPDAPERRRRAGHGGRRHAHRERSGERAHHHPEHGDLRDPGRRRELAGERGVRGRRSPRTHRSPISPRSPSS